MKIVSLLVALAATALPRRLRRRGGPLQAGLRPDAGGQEQARRCSTVARCMREPTGSTCPTRSSDGGRVTQRMEGRQPGEDARRREGVREVPQAHQGAARCPPPSKEEFKKAALANARCMREHGIDFPDPEFERQRRRAGRDRQGPDDPEDADVPGGAEGVREDAAGRAGTATAGEDEKSMRRRRAGRRRRSPPWRAAGIAVGDRRRDAGQAAAQAPGDGRPAAVERTRPRRPRERSPERSATPTPARSPPAAAGTLTALRDEGSVVTRGHSLYAVDGEPAAFLFYGALPAWRDFGPGMTDGDDVRQLERNLRALGYDPGADVDDDWTWETTAAVKQFQHDRGLDDDGKLARGEVVFRDGPTRIGEARPPSATRSAPGRPLGEVSSEERGERRPRRVATAARARRRPRDGRAAVGPTPSTAASPTSARSRPSPRTGRRLTVTITRPRRRGGQARPGAGRRRLRRRAPQGHAGRAGQGAAGPPGRRVRGRGRRARQMVEVEPGLFADDMVEVRGRRAARGRQGGDGADDARRGVAAGGDVLELVDVSKFYPGGVEALRGVR